MTTGDTASDPFPRPWPDDEGEEGSLAVNGNSKVVAASSKPGSDIVKNTARHQASWTVNAAGNQQAGGFCTVLDPCGPAR